MMRVGVAFAGSGQWRSLPVHLPLRLMSLQAEIRNEPKVKAYDEKNPDVNRKAIKKYTAKYPVVYREAVMKYTAKNPDVNSAAVKRYNDANPDINRASHYSSNNLHKAALAHQPLHGFSPVETTARSREASDIVYSQWRSQLSAGMSSCSVCRSGIAVTLGTGSHHSRPSSSREQLTGATLVVVPSPQPGCPRSIFGRLGIRKPSLLSLTSPQGHGSLSANTTARTFSLDDLLGPPPRTESCFRECSEYSGIVAKVLIVGVAWKGTGLFSSPNPSIRFKTSTY
uniref:Uncharacterized protein n=1 Tax=Timema monikensis TaxID=170555 RepID=A0A7R9HQX8_9NEOP|nr:unnamed protein product [Timema monikensis]